MRGQLDRSRFHPLDPVLLRSARRLPRLWQPMGLATCKVHRRVRVLGGRYPQSDERNAAGARELRATILRRSFTTLLQGRSVSSFFFSQDLWNVLGHGRCCVFHGSEGTSLKAGVERENLLVTRQTGYARRHENRYFKAKPALSEQVMSKLKDVLQAEYELYEFCKQRLHLQYRHITTGDN